VKRIIAVSFVVIIGLFASLGMGTSLAESPATDKVWEWTPASYAKVLRQYDISEKDIETILRVLKCESNFRNIQSEIIKNGVREPSFGIAQIHLPSHSGVTMEQALDEEFSIH